MQVKSIEGEALKRFQRAIAVAVVGVGNVVEVSTANAAGAQVAIVAPAPNDVFSWGVDTPAIPLSARLDGGSIPPGSRLYMTANVLMQGRIVDGVRLYDDGTHGDSRSGDGTFTATYRPPTPADYQVKVRAQWDGSQRGDAWTDLAPFVVERVPYAHIAYPEPGGRVGREATLRARLLQGGALLKAPDPTLRIEARTATAPAMAPVASRNRGRRNGTVATTPLKFDGVGRRWVQLAVSVERRGRRLETLSAPLEVNVSMPPIGGFWAAGVLLLLAALLRRRRSLVSYRHTIAVKDLEGRFVKRFELDDGMAIVKKTVGGPNAEIAVANGTAHLCTLTASCNQPKLRVEAGAVPLKVKGQAQTSADVEPSPHKPAFRAGNLDLFYESAVPLRSQHFPFWYPTRAKITLFTISLLMLGAAIWQYRTFFTE